MRTMPAGAPARNGMNVYEIYAGDLSRRVGMLTGNRRPLPLSPHGVRPAVPSSSHPVLSEFFEEG
jgi:hypothetical protein